MDKLELIHERNKLMAWILYLFFFMFLIFTRFITDELFVYSITVFISGSILCAIICYLNWRKKLITQTMYICVFGMSIFTILVFWHDPHYLNFLLVFFTIFTLVLYQNYGPIIYMGIAGTLIGSYYHIVDPDRLLFTDPSFGTYLASVVMFMIVAFFQIHFSEQWRKRVEHLAYHDVLTGIANRTLFGIQVKKAMDKLEADHKLAILFIDIDNFKLINDNLRHDEGDQFLIEAALKINQCIDGSSGLVARMGGDEFSVLLPNISSAHDALQIAKEIKDTLKQSYYIGNAKEVNGMTGEEDHIQVTASIGISIYPDHGRDHSTLYKNADMAMYWAKHKGKNGYKLFNDTLQS